VVKLERKVGINGFGRVGRAIFRIILQKKLFDVVVINETNPDNKNMAYQLKYDSVCGRLNEEITSNESGINIDGKEVIIYHEKNIDEVPWEKYGITRVIDASGVYENVVNARNLRKMGIKQVMITHSPDEKLLDKSIIMGVNEEEIDIDNDLIISTSICDANALAPVMNVLNKKYGIDHGFVTTLHPWLSYQNLLDGQAISWSMPGSENHHYVLGRASTMSLIPKLTTTVIATCKVLKSMKNKLQAFL
jgi:glyceraldehyde 3-phosphate dehydrogenase